MYLTKTPHLLKPAFPDLVWNIPVIDKTIFLTFDDGPTEFITEKILDILDAFGAKATFFCVGNSIQRFPYQYSEIIHRGHAIGNHTYDHLNGWSSRNYHYFKNVLRCNELTAAKLFRPPYGKISLNQIQTLKSRYKIIMWDVLSADWDASKTGADCYKNVISGTVPGSIIVFHDSLKAEKNMLYALPRALAYFKNKGYKLKALDLYI